METLLITTNYTRSSEFNSAADLVLDTKDLIAAEQQQILKQLSAYRNEFKTTRSFAVLKLMISTAKRYNYLVDLDDSLTMPVR